MFDELTREIRRLGQGTRISVPVPTDAEGYLDRQCPSEECRFEFKILGQDWREKVRDEEMFCPFCRHAERANEWATEEQVEGAKRAAFAELQRRLGRAMKRDADRWNSRQPRNAFIRITMNVSQRPFPILLPMAAAEPMRLKIVCSECSCSYAVIGAAFFCPACGHNSADLMFNQSLASIRATLDALGVIRDAMPDQDARETAIRLMIEAGLQHTVTALQRYAEALYAKRFPSQPAPRQNAFQNLSEGGDLWRTASGRGYESILAPDELAALERYFQQRHLLTHRDGLVDDRYVQRTGDTTWRAGQRLVIREAGVRHCVTLIEKLARGIAS